VTAELFHANGRADRHDEVVVIMRTQLASHHCTRLSIQLGKMVHVKERQIVEWSQQKGYVCGQRNEKTKSNTK
jgi:hypothetical protein